MRAASQRPGRRFRRVTTLHGRMTTSQPVQVRRRVLVPPAATRMFSSTLGRHGSQSRMITRNSVGPTLQSLPPSTVALGIETPPQDLTTPDCLSNAAVSHHRIFWCPCIVAYWIPGGAAGFAKDFSIDVKEWHAVERTPVSREVTCCTAHYGTSPQLSNGFLHISGNSGLVDNEDHGAIWWRLKLTCVRNGR